MVSHSRRVLFSSAFKSPPPPPQDIRVQATASAQVRQQLSDVDCCCFAEDTPRFITRVPCDCFACAVCLKCASLQLSSRAHAVCRRVMRPACCLLCLFAIHGMFTRFLIDFHDSSLCKTPQIKRRPPAAQRRVASGQHDAVDFKLRRENSTYRLVFFNRFSFARRILRKSF